MLLLFCGLSQAFEPVIQEVSGGQIDWTELPDEVKDRLKSELAGE